MKKLFILGALALASFSFANTKESSVVKESSIVKESSVIKDYKVIETKLITQDILNTSDKKVVLRMWWSVTFELPCGGGTMTVTFPSDNVDMWFSVDLANAIISGVEAGCNKKAEMGLL